MYRGRWWQVQYLVCHSSRGSQRTQVARRGQVILSLSCYYLRQVSASLLFVHWDHSRTPKLLLRSTTSDIMTPGCPCLGIALIISYHISSQFLSFFSMIISYFRQQKPQFLDPHLSWSQSSCFQQKYLFFIVSEKKKKSKCVQQVFV